MSDIKKSDQWMGTFGILFTLIVVGWALLMVSMLIDLQEDFNDLADETCADAFFGCTAEEEKEIDEFMESVQSKVIVWQAMWGFVVFSGLFLAYASIRLLTGTNLFRGLVFPEGHSMHIDDRRYFIFTLVGVTLIAFGVGYGEVTLTDGFYDDIDDLADSESQKISKDDRDSNTLLSSNGGITGSCNTVFLFLMLILAFFTRGPGKTDELPFIEATQSDGGTETSLDDLLGTTGTTEEQTDEE